MAFVGRPSDKTAASRSSIMAKPEPFQYPIGRMRMDASIGPGSLVNTPLLSNPAGKGMVLPFKRVVCSLPYEYCDIAMSRTTFPFSRGTAMTKGLLPSRVSFPPHAGMHDSVLVQLIA